jgi:hypothetical protein
VWPVGRPFALRTRGSAPIAGFWYVAGGSRVNQPFRAVPPNPSCRVPWHAPGGTPRSMGRRAGLRAHVNALCALTIGGTLCISSWP